MERDQSKVAVLLLRWLVAADGSVDRSSADAEEFGKFRLGVLALGHELHKVALLCAS